MIQTTRPHLRPDFLKRQRFLGDSRDVERLVAHYLLERELSDRLRHAPREVRPQMYTAVYSELFASLSDHPQHESSSQTRDRTSEQLRRIAAKLRRDAIFLEIGCGDAALGVAASPFVRTAYGLDVTDALIDSANVPQNFKFLATSGVDIPLAAEEVDFAYSNQLMEHLHPNDATDQLAEVYRVLKPGGAYMCITPSRITGPHDISCYFDYEASCLHLKEYDYGVLRAMFRQVGFPKFCCSAWIRGREIRLPYRAIRAAERFFLFLPQHIRSNLTSSAPLQTILGLTVFAIK